MIGTSGGWFRPRGLRVPICSLCLWGQGERLARSLRRQEAAHHLCRPSMPGGAWEWPPSYSQTQGAVLRATGESTDFLLQ